jgi:hypothetical protein
VRSAQAAQDCVKILLDESVPRLLKLRLRHLNISTVLQHHPSGRNLAILVLPRNQVPLVARRVPVLESLLKRIQPGVVMDVPLD